MSAGIVAILIGGLIILSRGALLLFPASTLRWFRNTTQSTARIRVLGAVVTLLALTMVAAGAHMSTGLEALLFIFGLFILVVAIPALLLVPTIYMNLAHSFIPTDLSGTLLGWRMLGLVGAIIGIALSLAGFNAL